MPTIGHKPTTQPNTSYLLPTRKSNNVKIPFLSEVLHKIRLLFIIYLYSSKDASNMTGYHRAKFNHVTSEYDFRIWQKFQCIAGGRSE